MGRKSVRSKRWKFILPLIGLAVTGYFAYHVVHGTRGFIAWQARAGEVAELERKAAKLRHQRMTLERRVNLLSPASLDPDMLEERARILLNYSHPNEIIVLFEDR